MVRAILPMRRQKGNSLWHENRGPDPLLYRLSSHTCRGAKNGAERNPGYRFAQPGANVLAALRAAFARRRRDRSLAWGKRAKRATPGTRNPKNRTPEGCEEQEA